MKQYEVSAKRGKSKEYVQQQKKEDVIKRRGLAFCSVFHSFIHSFILLLLFGTAGAALLAKGDGARHAQLLVQKFDKGKLFRVAVAQAVVLRHVVECDLLLRQPDRVGRLERHEPS